MIIFSSWLLLSDIFLNIKNSHFCIDLLYSKSGITFTEEEEAKLARRYEVTLMRLSPCKQAGRVYQCDVTVSLSMDSLTSPSKSPWNVLSLHCSHLFSLYIACWGFVHFLYNLYKHTKLQGWHFPTYILLSLWKYKVTFVKAPTLLHGEFNALRRVFATFQDFFLFF